MFNQHDASIIGHLKDTVKFIMGEHRLSWNSVKQRGFLLVCAGIMFTLPFAVTGALMKLSGDQIVYVFKATLVFGVVYMFLRR
jgi:hypothetical protein